MNANPSGCAVRRRSAGAQLLGLWVRFPRREWLFVCCFCCMLCKYRPLWQADHPFREVLSGVCVCDLETSTVRHSREKSSVGVTASVIFFTQSRQYFYWMWKYLIFAIWSAVVKLKCFYISFSLLNNIELFHQYQFCIVHLVCSFYR